MKWALFSNFCSFRLELYIETLLLFNKKAIRKWFALFQGFISTDKSIIRRKSSCYAVWWCSHERWNSAFYECLHVLPCGPRLWSYGNLRCHIYFPGDTSTIFMFYCISSVWQHVKLEELKTAVEHFLTKVRMSPCEVWLLFAGAHPDLIK